MSFVDFLRSARQGPTPLLHEFKTNYDPQRRRVHGFVEGHEDLVFYRSAIEEIVGPKFRVYMYRCGNKKAVYETFRKLTLDGTTTGALFFADKDLSDILGETWPIDENIFVTEVYSIENYFVSRATFERLCRDLIRLGDFTFEFEPVFAHFESELCAFHRLMLTVMAWIASARAAGLRPNLNNIKLGEVFSLSDDGSVKASKNRLRYIARATGVDPAAVPFGEVRKLRRRFAQTDPKLCIRGHFEMWFMISFTLFFIQKLGTVAKEVGGSVSLRVQINQQNPVETLIGRVPTPDALTMFLTRHFPLQEGLF
jgi:hypothetical protein